MCRSPSSRLRRWMLLSILGYAFAPGTATQGGELPKRLGQSPPTSLANAHQEPRSRSESSPPRPQSLPTVPSDTVERLPRPPRAATTLRPADAAPPTGADAANPQDRDLELPFEKPLRQIDLDTQVRSGSVPDNVAAQRYATDRFVVHPASRGWESNVYFRETPRFRHHPLYFDQRLLERGTDEPFGHFAHFGPVLAGTRFLADTLTLPFQTAAAPPHALGWTPHKDSLGRPRNWQTLTPAQRTRGAAFQSLTVASLILLIP